MTERDPAPSTNPPARGDLAAGDGVASRLFARVVQAVEDWRARQALRRELFDLSACGTLDPALAEAGIDRAQLETVIAGHPAAARQFDAMLGRLGIDRRKIPSDGTLREMGWTCTTCRDKPACNDWLAEGRTEGFERFCPNHGQLSRLQAEQRATAGGR